MADPIRRQATIRSALAQRKPSKTLARALPHGTQGEIQEIDAGITELYTYFTIADGQTHEMLAAQEWIRIRLVLETAGPVVVSTRHQLSPLLSGRGRTLIPGAEVEFDLKRGDRLYILSETVNRVGFIAQRVPYGDRVLERIDRVVESINNAAGVIARAIGGRFSPDATDTTPIPPTGAPPCPPPRRVRQLLRNKKIR